MHKARWCTGTLGLRKLKHVFNLSTHSKPRSKLEDKINQHLKCTSKGGQLSATIDSKENEDLLLSRRRVLQGLEADRACTRQSADWGHGCVSSPTTSRNGATLELSCCARTSLPGKLQLISQGTAALLPVMDSNDAADACLVPLREQRSQ